jgi:predicted branched-subunit amino acid permease
VKGREGPKMSVMGNDEMLNLVRGTFEEKTHLCCIMALYSDERGITVKKSEFLVGLKAGLPICFGYLSVSFAFGIFAVETGLSVWQTLLVSMTNVTSAGQLAGVPLLVTGASFAEMALTQLVINLRYSLMSVTLAQKLDGKVNLLDKLLISFVNTDEVFAVSVTEGRELPKAFMYGLILTPYLGWACGTLLGATAGNVLPESVVSALGIAIYGMFVAIVVPPAVKNRNLLIAVGLACAISCAFKFLPVLSGISGGFAIILSAVPVSLAMAFIRPILPEEEKEAAA